jgi:hypothetical protein
MGDILLRNPMVHFYLLYFGALVVIHIIGATTRRPKPEGKTPPVGVEAQAADGSRNGAP